MTNYYDAQMFFKSSYCLLILMYLQIWCVIVISLVNCEQLLKSHHIFAKQE
jgi:biopolymer transport protein ExbB/TolQ